MAGEREGIGSFPDSVAVVHVEHCDLSTPQSVNVSAFVEKLQGSYLESVNACSGVKMQQYLNPRSEVDPASYTPAAYLQAIGGWRQCKRLAQLRAG